MANWFGRYFSMSTKASQFGSMTVRQGLGQAAWQQRNAQQLALEGYQRNVMSFRCIQMVAQAAASVPFCLFNRGKELSSHELLDLLAKPNPVTDGTSLLQAWYSWLQINGNGYLERVDGLGQKPIELYCLRSDRVKVVPGANGLPEAFDYSVGGSTRRVPVDYAKGKIPLLHLRTFNPLDDWYGMSPIDPASWSIDTHSGAGSFNTALLRNSAVPSGALKVMPNKDGTWPDLTEEQRKDLKADLEAQFGGTRNAGRPMVLEGGLDWVPFGMTLKDMQFTDMKNSAAREIALAFGVPPMLLGIPGDNTYSNYREANLAFWRQTVLPLVAHATRALSGWLAPAWASNLLELRPNIDNLDALSEQRKEQWDRVSDSQFLTVNEKREATGYDKLKDGDVVVLTGKPTTLERAIEGTTDEKGKKPGGNKQPTSAGD